MGKPWGIAERAQQIENDNGLAQDKRNDQRKTWDELRI